MYRLGIVLVLLGLIVSISTIYLSDNATYAQNYDVKKSYAEKHNLEPIVDKDGKKQFLIMYKKLVQDKDMTDLKAEAYAKIKKKFDFMPGVVASMDEKWIPKIKAKKNVAGIYEDYRVHAVLDQSIPQINADLVQNSGLLGSGVNVCIIDTGVDDSHPSLSALIAESNYNANPNTFGPNSANDDNGHGTHVAGIVGSNDSTFKGVAPSVSFMASKVLNQVGSGSFSDVLAGINWCVANGADVLNLSLGGGLFDSDCDPINPNNPQTTIEQVAVAISNAYDQGVVTVAASGNQGFDNLILAPACASKAIAVGAVNDNDNRYLVTGCCPPGTVFAGSNGGTELNVVAPGVSIKSTLASFKGGDFGTKTGTSMATPHVAGAAASLLSYDSSLGPGDVQTLLEQNAVDLGAANRDDIFGWGRIDLWASILAADTTPPTFDTFPTDPTTLEGNISNGFQGTAFVEPTASDDVDPSPSITCDADPSDFYPIGNTIVTCTAQDTSNNSNQQSFTVVVVDTTPPVVTLNGDPAPTIEAVIDAPYVDPGAGATDAVEGSVTVVVGGDTVDANTPGVYTITYDASDSVPNAAIQVTRTVTVQDTTAPVVTPPVSITEEITGTAAGDVVNYPPATATDEVGVTSGPTCTPASGSVFPIGITIVTCTASDAAGNTGSATFSISVQDLDDNFGIYRHYPSWGGAVFGLSNVLSVPHDIVSFYGIDDDIPVTGDWDGDGVDTVGIYRHYPSWGGAVFALSNGFSDTLDVVSFYGMDGDIPVAGDWDGDGVDTVGIYRPLPGGGAMFALSNGFSEPFDIVFNYGIDGDVPVAGDWDGDGVDTVGIYRPLPGGGAMFALSNGFSEPFDIVFNYGIDGDVPVAGDWDGDGVDTVGIYRHYPSWGGAVFALSNGFSESYDVVSFYGMDGDIPVAGDWD